MEKLKQNKEKIFMVVAIIVLFVAVIGISYAAFSYTRVGGNLNSITTGVISMSYEESSNIISMDKALPTTDATGKVRLKAGEYFDFTVSTTIKGTTSVNYEIAAEDFSSNTFDGKNIRLYLTKLNTDGSETEVMAPKNFLKSPSENKATGRPANMMSLASGTISASESNKYRLRMYVDERYNPQGDGGNKTFSIRINVYGKVYEGPVGSRLKAYENGTSTDFHTDDYRAKTTSIVTKKDNSIPETVIESWDVSKAGDGSIMAYSESDGNDGYKITIGGQDGIVPESLEIYFEKFTVVTSIDLSAFDTSETISMEYIFNYCSKLINLNISSFNTSKVTSMRTMFQKCESLTKLDLNHFDTSRVTDMAGMFMYCTNLQNLDVSNFDTTKVINMYAMFSNCSNLSTMGVSNFNTSNVTNMSYMFNQCKNLLSLDVSKFDTSKVTDMSGMFNYCENLSNLDVSNFNTSNVTNMVAMFQRCYNLTSLDVSHFDTSKVTKMNGMFNHCENLSNLDVSHFDTSKVTNMKTMFQCCYKLTSLNVTNFDTSKVTDMGWMFFGCIGLTSLNVNNFNTSNVTSMDSMFAQNAGLTSLDLRNFDTSKVTDFKDIFNNSYNLKEIKVSSKWVVSSSATITDMFTNCGVSSVTTV